MSTDVALEGMTLAQALLGRDLQLRPDRAVMPRPLARSPLFAGVSPRGRRRRFDETPALLQESLDAMLVELPDDEPGPLPGVGDLALWDGTLPPGRHPPVRVCQISGWQLTQREGDYWLELVRHAINAGTVLEPGEMRIPIKFQANAILRSMKIDPDRQRRRLLAEFIQRIGTARLRVSWGSKTYTANLLDVAMEALSGDTGYVVYLDLPLARLLFRAGGWDFVNMKTRRALAHRPSAQWLHLFYTTHTTPWPYGEDRLQTLAGRDATRGDRWHEDLSAALVEVGARAGWQTTYSDAGNIDVIKRPAVPTAEKLQAEQDERAANQAAADKQAWEIRRNSPAYKLELRRRAWLKAMPSKHLYALLTPDERRNARRKKVRMLRTEPDLFRKFGTSQSYDDIAYVEILLNRSSEAPAVPWPDDLLA